MSPAEEGGVVIYDNGIARPNVLCGFIQPGCNSSGQIYSQIQWNADATQMFAVNTGDTGFDFYTIPVTSAGFGKPVDYPGLAGGFSNGIQYDPVTKKVYELNGSVIDPAAGASIGRFNASGVISPSFSATISAMVADGALGKIFFIGQPFGGNSTWTIASFDIQKFTPIATFTITNVIGSVTHLIRWGSDGLAFSTAPGVGSQQAAGAVYVLHGPFVSAAASQAPAIKSGGVVSGAAFQPAIAAGSWITIFGTNLAPYADTWSNAVVGGVLPTSLDGVSVLVAGQPAFISYVSPNQINALAPNIGTGNLSVSVTTVNGTTPPATVAVQQFQPEFFHWGNYVVATHTDYTIAAKAGTVPGVTSTPARPGETIILWGTGFGPTVPAAPVGIATPAGTIYKASMPVTAVLGSAPVNVISAALTPGSAGLYQIAIQIPSTTPDGDYPITATVGGITSPSSALITIQH